MLALAVLFAPLTVAVPDRPMERINTSWIGKTVFMKTSGIMLDPSPEPSDAPPKKGVLANTITYRVYAERAEHVQVKTREGVSGWLRKSDIVLSKDAAGYFTKQLQLKPNDLNLINRRAAAYRAIGEYDLAIKDATEAIRLSPSAALYNNRALIWHSKKDYDKAIADYAQALKLNPRYPLVLVNRATMWHGKKDYDSAIADCTQALQFQPGYPAAYRMRGVSHHEKKEYDKAIADFNRALELDAKSAQVHTDRAKAWAAKKEDAKALDDFNAALKLEPNNATNAAEAALWLASCADAKYRDGQRALGLARRAHKSARSNSLVLQALAAAYAETGQYTEASRWQEHALADPQIADDHTARARLDLYRKGKAYRRE